MQIATTPICKVPIRWFSSALSVAENAASAIVFFLPASLFALSHVPEDGASLGRGARRLRRRLSPAALTV